MSVWARIVIVAYNSADCLQACLNAVQKQSETDFEVVIVNNDCPQRSTMQVVLPDDRFRIIEAGRNLGFAGGANLGTLGASTEWIVVLNPDAIPTDNWLEEIRLAEMRRSEYDVLSSTIFNAQNSNIVESFGDVMSIYGLAWRGGNAMDVDRLPIGDVEVFGASGAAACYKRELFEAFGGFDEAYFCYLEDVDLAFRLQNANVKCLQVRNAVVLHQGGKSSENNPTFSIFQSYLNNLRLIIQNAPIAVLFPMIAFYLIAQTYIIIRNIFSPGSRARISGFVQSFATIPSSFMARKKAQEHTVVKSFDLIKRFAWHPRGYRLQSIHSLS